MRVSDYTVIFRRLFLSFVFFFLLRIIFIIYNYAEFKRTPLEDLFQIVIYGIRFDLSSVILINIFYIIFSLLPFRNYIYHKLIKCIFLLSNFFYMALTIADFEFFSFNGKKLTLDTVLIINDIAEQSLQLLFSYWNLSVLVIIYFLIFAVFYPRRKKNSYILESRLAFWKQLIISTFCFVICIIVARGGLQMKNISVKDAFVFKNYKYGHLVLNSAFTFALSIPAGKSSQIKYFESDKKAREIILSSRKFNFSENKLKRPNIVLIILESFSKEYISDGYTPFLSRLKKKSLSFDVAFSNGRRSIEALPSIMAGLPSILNRPFYIGPYQGNEIKGIPSYLSKLGYKSYFFHGGKTGTMNFDAFCRNIGIDRYYGLEDYSNKKHFDGHWGIYDHNFYEFMIKEIDKNQHFPFFSTFFSLSSHQPYKLPPRFKGYFPKGNLPIHESIGYADYSLSQFFEHVENKKWYQNTLFIITADHTQKSNNVKFQSLLGHYRVPIIFFHPSVKLLKKRNIAQHVDILPSILDLLDVKVKEPLLFGSSLFSDDKGRMINFSSGSYIYLKENTLLLLRGEEPRFYKVSKDYLKITPVSTPKTNKQDSINVLNELKAYIQYMKNGLIKNNFYKDN